MQFVIFTMHHSRKCSISFGHFSSCHLFHCSSHFLTIAPLITIIKCYLQNEWAGLMNVVPLITIIKCYLQKEWAGLMNGYIYSMVNIYLTAMVGVQ